MGIFKLKKSEDTRSFYDHLVEGKVSRYLWGKEKRFSPKAIQGKRSVKKHFTATLSRYISDSDVILDLGCGPGSFLPIIASLGGRVIGADITPGFIAECNTLIRESKINNSSAVLINPGEIPFPDNYFDKAVLIDTIHHMEDSSATLLEVHRILKNNGLLLIFEPNKLNPLLYLMCCLDKNEHGLLRCGTSKKYRQLLGTRFEVLAQAYNGLLIGPSGRAALWLADLFSESMVSPILGWLSPKIFIAAKKI